MTKTQNIALLLIGLCTAAAGGGGAEPEGRPISGAESVLAVYVEDWGLRPEGGPRLVLAAWPDGHAVWSEDGLRGGPPYRAGEFEPKRFAAWLGRLERDGALAEKGPWASFGPDSQFTTLLVRSGGRELKMQSWHELAEADGELVATDRGLSPLDGRGRYEALREASEEYLFRRLLWGEVRAGASELLPAPESRWGASW